MRLVEQMAAPEGRVHRQLIFFGKTRHAIASLLRPAAAAKDRDRRPRSGEQFGEFLHLVGTRRRLDRAERRGIVHGYPLDQHVLRNGDHDRAWPAVSGGMERARHDLRHARRVIDLGRPFGHRTEYRPVIELLEGFALARFARDLPDEHDERGGILARDVDAVRGIGRTGTAGDETDTGPAGHLADRFRHDGSAGLLAAHRDGQIAVMEGIEHREIALAWHAKDVTHAMKAQLIDQDFGGTAQIVLTAHRRRLLKICFGLVVSWPLRVKDRASENERG